MHNNELQLIQPSLDLEICIDADSCARELKRCADAADHAAALAQGSADIAIRHAWNAGSVCNKAKEVIPHGQFQSWLEANAGDRGVRTLQRWMKLAKTSLMSFLGDATFKTLMDAYIAAGVLPAPEPKEIGDTPNKPRLPWHPLKFSTKMEEWTKDQAMDFIYEFDRAAAFVRSLRQRFEV